MGMSTDDKPITPWAGSWAAKTSEQRLSAARRALETAQGNPPIDHSWRCVRECGKWGCSNYDPHLCERKK
jgi:hypothetical protein